MILDDQTIVTIDSPAGRLVNQSMAQYSSSNPRELTQFEFQILASFSPSQPATLQYRITDGELPESLSLNKNTGLISGTCIDMDEYIPEFMDSNEIDISGSNYGSTGSALAKTREFSFTVRASLLEDESYFGEVLNSILVVNNFSSDRDQFIREYADRFGEDGKLFTVDGVPVTASEYLANKNFPFISNV